MVALSLAPRLRRNEASTDNMLDPIGVGEKSSGVRFPPSLRRSRPSRESQCHLESARVEPARAGHASIGDIRIGAGSGENGAAGYGGTWS
jgi:hypothetical protein